MSNSARPFSAFEWLIAWRYLRARRKEGGVSVMTWISLIGIALAVFALIATLAVRSGFRTEFVATILGANAHVTVLQQPYRNEFGQVVRTIETFDETAERVLMVEGVTRAAPTIRGQVLAAANGSNAGVEVVGQRLSDVQTLPLLAEPEISLGDLTRLEEGIAIGSGVAQTLGVGVGDMVQLISPNGVQGPFGTSPRTSTYEVVNIFQVGRFDIDRVRVYMPFAEAQSYFNRDGVVDELEVLVEDPERIDAYLDDILAAAGPNMLSWTWQQSAGGFLRALEMEDNIMFVILSILVLIATLNITSGLIMLVKNKGRDVGILRTMGLGQGSILRVFFICGASIGIVGTAVGVVLGCLFAIYIDPIFNAVNWLLGGGVWDPSVRFISQLPAELQLGDVLSAVALSLGLSFVVTIFPARRAARMNPVEALRYE
ncbi:lipoprotein-releasing ABC transporter permease subunit [Pontivivens insulae]|uniref:Lipoprotein-releasing system transmembrane protein LolE n=1 Tax=Pontivivens insulae TaxID=1639689 RepID=A0A2R8ADX9_9RHOB|nr:lipoprotein-releasing ABC transporter permease subunit [Pontivivens insulae]RED14195.1 lipoprotein-releasing system permease protein [Pontivivens insulae]SPF30270.1 Lipoprotein-releasing system transmembrane protein LolE [Pontivivens insulae]